MPMDNGAALLAASVQAPCAAKAPRRTVSAVAAAVAATVSRPVAAAVATPASFSVVPSSAPDGIGAISDEKAQKLRAACKAKRQGKRDRQKETKRAASLSSDADMVAVDAILKSSSDHDAPALTSADVRTPGRVAMDGTIVVQMSVSGMGSDVVAGHAAHGTSIHGQAAAYGD